MAKPEGKPSLKQVLQKKLKLEKEVLVQIQAGMLPGPDKPGACSGTCPDKCWGGQSAGCTGRVSCASRCTVKE